jgi:outer membrane protein assembly factor BamB
MFADPNPVAPPDAAGLDEFGAAVAVGGTLVAVGAPGDATYGTNAGAVYVFTRDTGALLRRLDAPGAFAGARFGAAVAIAGGDVVVGAPSPDVPGAGAVHVFAGRTGALRWSVSEPPALGDRLFGWAVAASGRRIVVGVPCRDVEQNAGAAVVYDRRTGAALASFTAPVPEACDFFGGAVAAAGRTIVIGARLSGPQDTGAAYLFDADSGGLVATFADGTPEADVGWSVAAAPHRVVIGAAGEDGAVRVYGKTH